MFTIKGYSVCVTKKEIKMKQMRVMCLSLLLCFALAACNSAPAEETGTAKEAERTAEPAAAPASEETEKKGTITKDDIEIKETLESSADGEHVITADGESKSISNTAVNKSGEAEGDEADFYGENAAIFATNGGTLNLSDLVISTDGTHANAVFSYGEGTTVTIQDSVIETSGNCSGGLMTTGGGVMNAENLNIITTGNSSAAIRSDRGGGVVTVTKGNYTTEGKGSPVIYSTADITVNDAVLASTASQGVVVEGKNSVTLNNVELTADNNTKNSDKSDYYQAVMIYQSMSGDADEGLSSFAMNGGSLTNLNGDIFFVNNTVTEISLNNAVITNEDETGVFLRASAAGWGNEGSNGGQVTLNAVNQKINGDVLADSVSHVNLILKEGSQFSGAINPQGQEGEVYVELDQSSKWVLSADSYITSLTCEEGTIDLNGHTLYVNGTAYEGGASSGKAIEAVVSSSGHGEGRPEGKPGEMGEKPDGKPGDMGGTPPEKPGENGGERPEGSGAKPDGEPPAKPQN